MQACDATGKAWSITQGKVVGAVRQTPPREHWGRSKEAIFDHEDSHSDCLPRDMASLIARADSGSFVDVTSLAAPEQRVEDDKFIVAFSEALQSLSSKELDKPVVIRMLFGHIPGMATNCRAVCEALTKKVNNSSIHIWVGAYRKALSWNHSKIIAVDGKYLYHGGHNLWDAHYCRCDPVHDLSMETEGQCAVSGHLFANKMCH